MMSEESQKVRSKAGRKNKFTEKSTVLTVRVPISRKKEVMAAVESFLKKYEQVQR